MRIRCIPEQIPGPLPSGACPQCGRLRIPYLPTCLCGTTLEPEVASTLEASSGLRAPRDHGVFRIAHWSDLHVGSRTPGGLEVEVALRALLSGLRQLEVDGLIVSGDLSKFGKRDELMLTRELFDAYGYGRHRRIVVPGNHDVPPGTDGAMFREIFETQYPYVEEFGPKVWVAAFDSNVVDQRMLFERRWVNVRGLSLIHI